MSSHKNSHKYANKASHSSYKISHQKIVPVEFVANGDHEEDYLTPPMDDNSPIPMATAIPTDTNIYQNEPPQELEEELADFAQFIKQKSQKGGMSTNNNQSKHNQNNPNNNNNNNNNNNPNHKSNLKAWPSGLRQKIVESFLRPPNEVLGNKFLNQHGWPAGLKDTVFKSRKKIPLRFFIVDDSGSMITADGRRVVKQANNSKLIKCTRWSELTESMIFLAELSEALEAPSEFRLLNGSDPIIVGLGDDHGESLKFLREVMNESPAGPTPLCAHITAVAQSIQSVERELRANGQRAVVVIASDGESSDGNVAEALRPLTNLPVLVIVRLCTEEQPIVDYWNGIDNQLELDIDVIDDQLGDAKQVQQVNGWLTYGEPIHRLREFGASMKELDIIDESTLSADQMRVMCSYLFYNGDVSKIPHPGVEWRAFIKEIKECNRREPLVFCSITQSMKPWIETSKLSKFFSAESAASGGSCILS